MLFRIRNNQDCSVASGTRAGLQGARSGLFFEQIRITKELRDADILRGRTGKSIRPRYFCWENVPGAFSSGSSNGEDFRIVLEEIVRLRCSGLSVPRPLFGRWKSVGAIRVDDTFSLAWRVLAAELCAASHNSAYVQNGIMKRKNQNPVFPVINS